MRQVFIINRFDRLEEKDDIFYFRYPLVGLELLPKPDVFVDIEFDKWTGKQNKY